MKLTAELVPSTVWYSSLYRLLPRDVWNNIREGIIAKNSRKCQICGKTQGTMNLHEIRNYDDAKHVQKLDGFILLCVMCHHVKHIGLAGILANQGKLDYGEVARHFCRVNACSEKEFAKHVDDVFRIWKKRSQFSWKQDFGEYGKYLKK
jgi:5-methylcytosine-specific restriction endonuclease McrA